MDQDMELEIMLSEGMLGPNQVAALRDLVRDVGLEAYRQSKLYAFVAARQIEDAADEFLTWVFVDGELSLPLWERRVEQQRLFLLEAFA